jgi:glycine cleavage system transcriptional repressor
VATLAICTLGDDRPGIIAAVTGVLLRAGCNVEDSAMTRLRGTFAMMLVVDSPIEADALEEQLRDVAAELGLVVTLRPDPVAESDEPSGQQFSVSVYGADHPGIVHAVTSLLASYEVNIVDVVTHLLGARHGETHVYMMVLEVTAPPGVDEETLRAALQTLGREQGVQATITPVDAEIL